MAIEIREAAPGQMRTAEELFREYASTLPATAQESLRHQGFEQEMAGLPGKYARPSGCILLALVDAKPAGIVALREIAPMPGEAPRICEMKRMYVRPSARGLGLGRALAERLIVEARAAGFRVMKLDTEPDLAAAVKLYRSLGFRDIPNYNQDPVPCTLFMGLELSGR